MRKIALITGASSDIGQYIATSLAQCGFDIAAHYYQNSSLIKSVEKELLKNDVQVQLLNYDLMSIENVKNMVDNVVARFKRIDVLINTIGPFYYRDILEVKPEQWAEAINTNLNLAFNVIHHAMPHIIKAKGHIINFTFSGVENLKSWPMSTDYCAAKAGILVLTKTLATKLAPHGVRVNAVSPGMIKTESSIEEELLDVAKQLAKPIPNGRTGKPQEVAEVVKWLVTESPSYITGVSIPVAGAWEY